jgi:hypothetical protein
MNPLVSATDETTDTLLSYSVPLHLKHQPIFMVPYEHFDGPYRETDVKYLSIGLAQWRNPEGDPDAVSAKVWRYGDRKWSRMSEEIPLHRLADLCTFMACCVFGMSERDTVELPEGTFERQTAAMEARQLQPFPANFREQRDCLSARLRALRDVLNSLNLSAPAHPSA